MLTRIGLKNFKLHADTTIDAAPLTVFIGPNNGGKSSIFQALLLWRQAAARNSHNLCTAVSRQIPSENQPYLFPDDQLIDIGDFDQVVRRGEREVSISVSGNYSPRRLDNGAGPRDGSFEVRIRDNRVVYHKGQFTYEALGQRGRSTWELPGGAPAQIQLNLGHTVATINLQPQPNMALLGGLNTGSAGPVSPEQSIAMQELATQLRDSVRSLLSSIHPVFPIRGFEEAGYPLAPAPAETLDRMVLADRTTAMLSVLAYNRRIEERLSAWLERLVGIRVETELLSHKRVRIVTSRADSKHSASLFSNEGTGASQLPFILVPIGLISEGDTILLSEPEVHLHPKLQVQLTRLLIQLTKEENRQFFIETHSEHVLHALLNSVAAGALDIKDLAIFYVDSPEEKSVCNRLHVDERGGVEGGLPGFFEQSLGELAEYLEALKPK